MLKAIDLVRIHVVKYLKVAALQSERDSIFDFCPMIEFVDSRLVELREE